MFYNILNKNAQNNYKAVNEYIIYKHVICDIHDIKWEDKFNQRSKIFVQLKTVKHWQKKWNKI